MVVYFIGGNNIVPVAQTNRRQSIVFKFGNCGKVREEGDRMNSNDVSYLSN